MTDKDRIDFLQSKLGTYTGKVTCRWSGYGRGWRLHETNQKGSTSNIREAIDRFINEETK